MSHKQTIIPFIVFAALASPIPALKAEDLDGDGLEDSLESELLIRHRPVLYYEAREKYWPISISKLVQHSALAAYFKTNAVIQNNGTIKTQACAVTAKRPNIYTESQLSNNPSLILQGLKGFGFQSSEICINDTSMLSSPDPSVPWQLDLNDSWRNGVYPEPDGRAHSGLYGHVMPFGQNQILVQYWQLFAFNEARCSSDCGDHEGDFVWIDLILNVGPDYPLQKIIYHHHGDRHCAPMTVPSSSDQPSGWPKLALQGDIPICFIEGLAHEWWPFGSGGGECCFVEQFFSCLCSNPSHSGDGVSYRVPSTSIINVGEWYAPMPGSLEAQLFILYNGRYGDWGAFCDLFFGSTQAEPPDSPLLQSSTAFPSTYAFPYPERWRFLSGGVSGGSQGNGHARTPWVRASDALSSSPAGTVLRVLPGSYTAVGKWANPMTLTAPLGPVTLGQ